MPSILSSLFALVGPENKTSISFRGLLLAILVGLVPFFTGYGYLYLNVQKSIRERRIQRMLLRREELRKRNRALKKELSRYSLGGLLRESPNAIDLLEHSQIIHLELPPLPKQNKGASKTPATPLAPSKAQKDAFFGE